MWKAPAMPPNAGSSAWLELNEDGTVTVGLGGQDIGQGAFTIGAQIAAADFRRALRLGTSRYPRLTPNIAPTNGKLWPAASPGVWVTPLSTPPPMPGNRF